MMLITEQSEPWTLFKTHSHSCLHSETPHTSGILHPQSSVHLTVVYFFSPTQIYAEMKISAWDFSFFFFFRTKDLQKKSQCQIQRLPKLLIHQIILAMTGFWGHQHRIDWPRPEIGHEKRFMYSDQKSRPLFFVVNPERSICNHKLHSIL